MLSVPILHSAINKYPDPTHAAAMSRFTSSIRRFDCGFRRWDPPREHTGFAATLRDLVSAGSNRSKCPTSGSRPRASAAVSNDGGTAAGSHPRRTEAMGSV